MRKQTAICIVLLAGGIFLLACGCGFSRHQPEPVTYYALHYDVPEPQSSMKNITGSPVVVRVKRLQTHPPFNTTHIVYADNPYKRSRYLYHQWITTPTDMLTSLLVRDIEATGPVGMTVSTTPGKAATHLVEGTIVDFYENDEKPEWEAVLVLRLALTRLDPVSRSEEILFQKTYRETRPLKKNNPYELARSMSKAMEVVSSRFIGDMYENLR